jgi:hypothetical protein
MQNDNEALKLEVQSGLAVEESAYRCFIETYETPLDSALEGHAADYAKRNIQQPRVRARLAVIFEFL